MLLDFTVENWMSYRDNASLNMVASLERQHSETLAKIPGFRSKKALPISAIYGGNASGKTGIFRGLAALKHLITVDPGVNGILPIDCFKLDPATSQQPTVFDITFLADGTVYRYVLEATVESVSYESLEWVKEKGSSDIFERVLEGESFHYEFSSTFFGESDHLDYVAKSTRANQTFLGSAFSQNVIELGSAFRWFADALSLVGVESNAWSFATAADSQEGFIEFAATTLERLDTGISGLEGERVGIDALPKDSSLRKRINSLAKDECVTVVMENTAGDYEFEMFTVHSDGAMPTVERMRTVHTGADGKQYGFSLGMESSGTQRLMGLLPMLFDLQTSDGSSETKVYVVDELDRCLHTMLTSNLIEEFLESCNSSTKKQLLFTTHDLLLMDQSLMRRDEMYIAQRAVDGCSELIGLSEFQGIRFDKDLIRSYLDGRFGGIPMLGDAGVEAGAAAGAAADVAAGAEADAEAGVDG